jgi:hypothetical protein
MFKVNVTMTVMIRFSLSLLIGSVAQGITMNKLSLFLLLLLCAPTMAAPKAELWDYWQAHNSQSTETVTHDAWDTFLQKHLSTRDDVAVLDYSNASADKKLLDSYLKRLSQTPVRMLNRDEQRAFWINLYNALTVRTILKNYPVDSIRDISSGFLSFGPWDEKIITIENTELSLNDIEHRILRPIWQDARLHYAVNCASIGCPNLAAHAFTATNGEALLEAAAAAYINHPRGVQIQNGVLHVSSIYDWFKIDFGNDDIGVIAHLKKYAEPSLFAKLQNISAIAKYDYDWSLNDK